MEGLEPEREDNVLQRWRGRSYCERGAVTEAAALASRILEIFPPLPTCAHLWAGPWQFIGGSVVVG